MMTQHQKNEEKKRKFEEDIIEVAVAEYYHWVEVHKDVRSEKHARMFYDAMRLGIVRGINFATNQYMQSLKNFEEEKKNETGHQDKANQV
jgi:hypothetical protein